MFNGDFLSGCGFFAAGMGISYFFICKGYLIYAELLDRGYHVKNCWIYPRKIKQVKK